MVQAHGTGYGGSGFKFDTIEEEERRAARKVCAPYAPNSTTPSQLTTLPLPLPCFSLSAQPDPEILALCFVSYHMASACAPGQLRSSLHRTHLMRHV